MSAYNHFENLNSSAKMDFKTYNPYNPHSEYASPGDMSYYSALMNSELFQDAPPVVNAESVNIRSAASSPFTLSPSSSVSISSAPETKDAESLTEALKKQAANNIPSTNSNFKVGIKWDNANKDGKIQRTELAYEDGGDVQGLLDLASFSTKPKQGTAKKVVPAKKTAPPKKPASPKKPAKEFCKPASARRDIEKLESVLFQNNQNIKQRNATLTNIKNTADTQYSSCIRSAKKNQDKINVCNTNKQKREQELSDLQGQIDKFRTQDGEITETIKKKLNEFCKPPVDAFIDLGSDLLNPYLHEGFEDMDTNADEQGPDMDSSEDGMETESTLYNKAKADAEEDMETTTTKPVLKANAKENKNISKDNKLDTTTETTKMNNAANNRKPAPTKKAVKKTKPTEPEVTEEETVIEEVVEEPEMGEEPEMEEEPETTEEVKEGFRGSRVNLSEWVRNLAKALLLALIFWVLASDEGKKVTGKFSKSSGVPTLFINVTIFFTCAFIISHL